MDETIATLAIKFKAERETWRQSLDELDRMQGEYRRKWEAPVRMGAGGGGRMGSTAGPNISGTSNGDVTWRLENAVAQTQARAEGAMGAASRIYHAANRGSSFSGGVDPELLREARADKRAAEREGRERRTQVGLDLQNKIDLSEMRRAQASKEDAAWGPIAKGESGGVAAKKPWYMSRIYLRSIVAVEVVDAIAGELNNEQNYKKAARIAGIDQNAQAQASLARTRGVYESVPLVGGMMYNAFNGLRGALGMDTEQSIQTQIALTQMQTGYQNTATSMGLNASLMVRGSQAMLAGNTFHGGEIRSAMTVTQAKASLAATSEELRSQAGYEGAAKDWSDLSSSERSYVSDVPFLGMFFRGKDVAEANAARDARNRDRDAGVNAVTGRTLSAVNAQAQAEATERGYEARYTLDRQQAQLKQGDYNNQYRYAAGAAVRTSLDFRATVADAKRRGMNADDLSILRNQGELTVQTLQQRQRDVLENYRWGSGMSYNPYVTSTLSHTDRGVETIGDQLDANTKALQDVASAIKGLSSRDMH